MNEIEIGKRIAERRKELRINQDQLALLAGTGRATISALENGRGARGITLGKLIALLTVLGLSLELRDA
jgi:transcriptional regulator with XRE-family HTH domain